MKRIFAGALALFSALTFGATLNPIQLLNPAGSTAGQVISSTGASTAPVWGGVTLSTVTGTLAVNHGGTGVSSASGTALDNITGFASTGFLTRTGAGAYAFQSTTNGITLGNLAQAAANTVLANGTGSTANITAYAMPSCSGSANALQYASGTGFACGSNYALLSSPAFNGTPTAPTATAGNSTTQLATTAFVATSFAPLASPTFTGSVTTPALTVTSGGAGITGGLTMATGAITPVSTAGIAGTPTNNNANAGSVGEYITNSTTATSLTTATTANATSASLTAGDWEVSCVATFIPVGVAPSVFSTGISTTSATLPASNTGGFVQLASTVPSGAVQVFASPTVRVSVASTTTTYCVVQSTFAAGTQTVNGFIRARRPR